ncbi:hypothetical protein LR48_Vigan02g069300 [Vigna angularis]|uniref:Uncharacterized protein n=1 Tax=Phaseolus angularis TaxID=3914 RepID=A0A0L9TVD2_PHAAN|nr:hypothetical protein LR48_Vigan02g069300 [Vigna angularis]
MHIGEARATHRRISKRPILQESERHRHPKAIKTRPQVGTLSSHVSKASQLKIKAQIQYNPLRFQQSPFNHHYKSIEKGATYEESNKSYVVKAVTVPSSESESEAFNSNNIVHSVKNFMAVLYQFINPYAMYGRALIPHLFMDLYVNGVNQVFDFEIDKGLGLNLMIGSTALIWNFVLSATLWTCYSVNLPFLRWKQYPVMASLVTIVTWAYIFPITYFLHMQTFVLKRPLLFTRSLIVSLLFMSFYTTGIALAKCLGNVVLGSILWYQTKYVDVTNPASTRSFYSLNWKLMMGAHVLLPLIK